MTDLSNFKPSSLDFLDEMTEEERVQYMYAQDIVRLGLVQDNHKKGKNYYYIELYGALEWKSGLDKVVSLPAKDRETIWMSQKKEIKPTVSKSKQSTKRDSPLVSTPLVDFNSEDIFNKIPTKKKIYPKVGVVNIADEKFVSLSEFRKMEDEAKQLRGTLIKREQDLLFFAQFLHLMNRADKSTWFKRAKNGKPKMLCAPNQGMRRLHEFLITAIDNTGFVAESDYAWQKGRTMKDHLMQHVNSRGKGSVFHRYWYILDIQDAFENVNLRLLAEFLFEALYSWTPFKPYDIFLFLKKYFSHEKTKGLARGLPASPMLFNVFMENWIDSTLRAFCKAMGVMYSRYGDDLVFSSNDEPISKMKRSIIEGCITGSLPCNRKKQRLYDLKKDKEFFLHGIGIRNGSRGAEIFYNQKTLKKVKGLLYKKLQHNLEDEHQLTGYLGYLNIKSWKPGKLNSLQKDVLSLHNQAFPKKK